MTSKLDHALSLAAAGFYVFPLWPYEGVPGKRKPGKTPKFKGWQEWATRDVAKVAEHWTANPEDNIGIYTGKFRDDEALVVIDVDNKEGKNGDAELLRLDLQGYEIPATRQTNTPSGGRHLFFRVGVPLRQGVDVLGRGLDIRSRGGYVVGPGSTIGGQPYRDDGDRDVEPSPSWLVERCGEGRRRRAQRTDQPRIRVDGERAYDRAARYLKEEAPLAIEGQGGDDVTYKVAARVKDFGVSAVDADHLMAEYWNPRCSPPWSDEDLEAKVNNAYAYGQEVAGVASPEADFDTPAVGALDCEAATLHPFDMLNKEYAFVIAGGGRHILRETTNAKGRFELVHLDMAAFHDLLAAKTISVGKKESPLTEEWMRWHGRRSYDGLVFMPQQTVATRWYNLWRGFAVEPAVGRVRTPTDATLQLKGSNAVATAGRNDSTIELLSPALDAFLDHALNNVCRGDEELFRWLIGYFAHLVQRPWEKPLTALVFKGAKGVGKNALVERVGYLLGAHFMVADSDRYLIGNFNGHMENKLFLVLDEAAWAGDKKAEGRLKGIITGSKHVIEHKGKGVYEVDNLVRIAILGNDEWLVPASADERRYAVFGVGDGRKQDTAFFEAMRVGMEQGEYPHLLRYLLDYDLTGINLNIAPRTAAMLEQKHQTLDPFDAWWLSSLSMGRLDNGDFGDVWPEEVDRERIRLALSRYCRERHIRSRVPDVTHFGRRLRKVCPVSNGRGREGDKKPYTYKLPTLEDARRAWDLHIGHAVEWTE